MKRVLQLFGMMALTLLMSCNWFSKKTDEPRAGGPCTYHTTIRPARLIQFVSRNENTFDALFEVQRAVQKDTISYNRIENRYITQQELNADSLRLDSIYQYRIYEIEQGACTPNIERIVLERYLP